MPNDSITVQVSPKVRRMWALRLAGWLLTLPRVDVYANGKRVGRPQQIPFVITSEDVEVGRVEP